METTLKGDGCQGYVTVGELIGCFLVINGIWSKTSSPTRKDIMRIFRYESGIKHYKTMTVGEFIDKLKKYPVNMPVLATWETIFTAFEKKKFRIEKHFNGGKESESCNVLIIDVDQG